MEMEQGIVNNPKADSVRQLRESTQYETGRRFRPRSFDKLFDTFAGLDPHFAKMWLEYGGGLLARDILDIRTRLLVLTGQYTMLERPAALEDTVEAAIREGVDLREVLEAILQCYVYGGEGVVEASVEAFTKVVGEHGLLDQVRERGLDVDATRRDRDLEAEKESWIPSDTEDPRLPGLIDRYGWYGISNGLRLRPGQHVNLISQFDAVDPEWCGLWLDMCFDGMYGRGVLDDRTRIMCIVADCIAAGDTYQYPRHMAGALREGATPRELLALVLQSCHIVGHPMIAGLVLNDLLRLLDEQGRLEELVDDVEKIPTLRRVVAARIAARSTVADLATADGLDAATGRPGGEK